MASQTLEQTEHGRQGLAEREEPNHTEVLRQLEQIVNSSLFRNSKRYPAFLRFIVEHTLAGRADSLKERTLGVEVFGRPSDYDTNADPVVRVTAGEIRKRLAQYYQAPGHEVELRLDLPVGSYVPFFSAAAIHTRSFEADGAGIPGQQRDTNLAAMAMVEEAAAHAIEALASGNGDSPSANVLSESKVFRRLRALLLALCAACVAAIAFRIAIEKAQERGSTYFWSPFFHAESATLIVLGVHSLGPDGRDRSPATSADAAALVPSKQPQSMLASMTSSDMVSLSDVVSYSALVGMLARNAHLYKTQSAATTTFDQLQRGPIVLIGGLNNPWTLRLTAPLRFHFAKLDGSSIGAIEDGKHPGLVWRFDNAQAALANSQDYAIVASFFEPQIEQHVMIVAGIGKSGTAAAANFLTNKQYLRSWQAQAPRDGKKNIELVLSTQIVEGQQGPPHVVAGYSW